MHVFFCSTSTSQTTGYARIGYVVINYLASQGHKVTHFAFQQYTSPIEKERPLHPNIEVIDVTALDPQTTFGYSIIAKEVRERSPDMVLVYNDMVVTSHIITALQCLPKTFRFVSYLDVVYPYQDLALLRHIIHHSDRVFVFSQMWKDHFESMGFPKERIEVFPHGFDTKTFYAIPKSVARQKLGLRDTDFIVLNTNRNSYRKALDIAIRAFLICLKRSEMADDLRLMLNCRMDITEGYDILQLIEIECLKLGLDMSRVVNHHVLQLPMPGLILDEMVNVLYNACDVGINTCVGEGFGLCNLEHAGLGAPQIVTDVGGLSDIFARHGVRIPVATRIRLARMVDTHSGEISITKAEDFAEALWMYYSDRARCAADGQTLKKHIRETYSWPKLLRQFHEDLKRPVAPQMPKVYWINLESRPDRRRHMEDQFRRLGIADHTRISPHVNKVQPHISCIRAHYEALWRAWKDEVPMAVVAEDDVVVKPADIPWDKLPKDWECVQLHYVNPAMLQAVGTVRPAQGLFKGYFMGCALYVMNRRGIERFLKARGTDGTLTVDILADKARAEEAVYRCVNTYCFVYPLANTDPSLGSDIPDSTGTRENAELIASLKVPDMPWSLGVTELPFHDHWHDSPQKAAQYLEKPKRFTKFWNDPWRYATKDIRGVGLCIEFGCFEGLTSLDMVHRLTAPDGKVVCVDPLRDDYRDTGSGDVFEGQYDRFMQNTEAERAAKKLQLIRKTTREAAEELRGRYARAADLVYVDGDHTEDGTAFDADLALHLTKPGGLIIFDDYGWPYDEGPKRAIDAFIDREKARVIVLKKEYVCIVRVTS